MTKDIRSLFCSNPFKVHYGVCSCIRFLRFKGVCFWSKQIATQGRCVFAIRYTRIYEQVLWSCGSSSSSRASRLIGAQCMLWPIPVNSSGTFKPIHQSSAVWLRYTCIHFTWYDFFKFYCCWKATWLVLVYDFFSKCAPKTCSQLNFTHFFLHVVFTQT